MVRGCTGVSSLWLVPWERWRGVVCFGFLALFAHQHFCVGSWDRETLALAAAKLFESQFQVAGAEQGREELACVHVGQPLWG